MWPQKHLPNAGAVYQLRNWRFPTEFYGLPAIQLRNLFRLHRHGVSKIYQRTRMPQQRKLAVLTAFVKAQETAALDEDR